MILSLLIILTGYFHIALAGPVSEKRCSGEFNDPKITYEKFGKFYVCTSVPAAYITYNQAVKEARSANLKFARANCGARIQEVTEAKIIAENQVATVISMVTCQ